MEITKLLKDSIASILPRVESLEKVELSVDQQIAEKFEALSKQRIVIAPKNGAAAGAETAQTDNRKVNELSDFYRHLSLIVEDLVEKVSV